MTRLKAVAAALLVVALTASPVSAAERVSVTFKNNADDTLCLFTIKLSGLDPRGMMYSVGWGWLDTSGNETADVPSLEIPLGTKQWTFVRSGGSAYPKSAYPKVWVRLSSGPEEVAYKAATSGCTVG